MANELTLFEQQLNPLMPRFEAVLGDLMPVERLKQTAMICVERNPKLLSCDRQTLFNSCMTFATLGLEIDGATGQGFIIPFGNRAQPVIGYKGFNTLAARSGFTVTGDVVREGDKFDYQKGSSAFVHHVQLLGGGIDRRIIAAWACAEAVGKMPIIEIMDIDELMAVKNKSPGAKKKDSPWNDPKVGFPAMCAKTVKRRIARSMPLNVMVKAAALDEAHEERGLPSQIHPEAGVVIDGEAAEVMPPKDTGKPDIPQEAEWIVDLQDGETHSFKNAAEFTGYWRKGIAAVDDVVYLEQRMKNNNARFEALRAAGQGDVIEDLFAEWARRKTELLDADE